MNEEKLSKLQCRLKSIDALEVLLACLRAAQSREWRKISAGYKSEKLPSQRKSFEKLSRNGCLCYRWHCVMAIYSMSGICWRYQHTPFLQVYKRIEVFPLVAFYHVEYMTRTVFRSEGVINSWLCEVQILSVFRNSINFKYFLDR